MWFTKLRGQFISEGHKYAGKEVDIVKKGVLFLQQINSLPVEDNNEDCEKDVCHPSLQLQAHLRC